ncbi:MAG: xanthine dehydrogenase family protein molybdopterin-binding subunit [Myxococcales bacterium]
MNSVGKPLARADGPAKVTGKARYAAEVQVSGVAHGVIVGSRIPKGRIAAIDTIAAEREPGVIAVLTHLNAMKLPGGVEPADRGDRVVQALQDELIRYSNQPVALVVADTIERATHAANLVKVREQAEKHTVRMDDEIKNAFRHDIARSSGSVPGDQVTGDPEAARKAAEVLVEETYETPPETHNPMEPHATVAVWTGADKLTLYDATQGIFGVRKKIAKAFALPPENVRVLTKFVGGGFGCKGSAWSHVVLAALAARQLGRPVKVVLTRPQMFAMVGGRPHTRQLLGAGATKDGKLTFLRHESTSTTSRFDIFLEPAAQGTRHQYATDSISTKHRLVRLDIGTPTYMRAPGESSGSFALESAMDELAVKLKMDPLELRLRNYAEKDPEDGKPFSSKSLRTCYQMAAKRFGWENRPLAPRSITRDGLLVGMGMATSSYPANQGPAKALARLMPDGTALVLSGAVDLGTGTYTVMQQVAADSIGLDPEQVRFDLGDTEMPEAPRSGGSTTAASVASAVLAAGGALQKRLVRMAVEDKGSPLHGARPEDVQVSQGKLTANGKSDSFADLVKRAGGRPIEERAEVTPEDERKKWSLHSFGAQFAEVLVDPELGTVRVSRLVGAFAAGRILNARLARSQFMGGMVWGIGMALHEHSVYDEKLGRIMTRDLADYHVPANADVPKVEPMFLEVEEDAHVNPSGVKGIGEIGITGTAAAIASAVYNATGRRIRNLPITPDKLLVV